MTRPGGLVTLTTDFGLQDPFVGQMKLALLGRCPAAVVVDLTHAITPFRPGEAGFWLSRSLRFLPPGSLHVAVVDPGVGTPRGLLAACCEDRFFLAPDNGLLGPVLVNRRCEVRRISAGVLAASTSGAPSATFHGRDIFAPLAGDWLAGRLEFADLGPPVDDWQRGSWPVAHRDAGVCLGEVVHVDRFGNLFSNIEFSLDVDSRTGQVWFGDHALPWVRTYGDAPPGTAVALVNALEVIEAAVVEGCAAEALGLQRGSPVRWALS